MPRGRLIPRRSGSIFPMPPAESYLNFGSVKASGMTLLFAAGVVVVVGLAVYAFVTWDEKKWDKEDESDGRGQ
jgi:hypothetical protein